MTDLIILAVAVLAAVVVARLLLVGHGPLPDDEEREEV